MGTDRGRCRRFDHYSQWNLSSLHAGHEGNTLKGDLRCRILIRNTIAITELHQSQALLCWRTGLAAVQPSSRRDGLSQGLFEAVGSWLRRLMRTYAFL